MPLLPLVAHLPLAVTACLLGLASTGFAYQLGRQQAFLDAVPHQTQGLAFGLYSTGIMTGQGLGPIAAGAVASRLNAGPAIALAGAAIIAAACGVVQRRGGGKLPAHVTAYLTMALCLFSEDDYEEVATKVAGSPDRWGCWDASRSVPTASGITQARKRLGRDVMAEVFEGVVEPVATMFTRGAWLRRWRLLAIDGFDVDVPDTPANAGEFGYAGSGENRSAYPKVRVVALSECGTHAFLAAEVDAYTVGEKTLANRLYPRLNSDELLTADRNFYSFGAWAAAADSGAALLWRAPSWACQWHRPCPTGPI